MAELPDLHNLTSAQTLRVLALQEAQLRELAERVKLQDEMIDALGAGLAKLCEAFPNVLSSNALRANLSVSRVDETRLTVLP